MPRNIFPILLLMTSSFLFVTSCATAPKSKSPNNIIFFIGDGMGQAVVSATRLQFKGPTGQLNMDQMPHTAFVKTYSFNETVTDSAAGATALSTGHKTNIGVISQDHTAIPYDSFMYEGKVPKSGKNIKTLLEEAKKRGKSIGVVTTSTVTHATPASFYAHHFTRKDEKTIANQLLDSELDLALGGGSELFKDLSKDKLSKFTMVKTRDELELLKSPEKPVLGLFAEDHMSRMINKKKSSTEPSLTEMTLAAIKILSANKNGYILVVEGAQIDMAAHQGKADHMLFEAKEFDDSIGAAINKVKSDDTLVVVTADHETGGLSINGYFPKDYPLIIKDKNSTTGYSVNKTPYVFSGQKPYPVLSFSTGPTSALTPKLKKSMHTGVDVPLYAWGTGAESFRGTIDNTDIPKIILDLLK